MGKMNTVKLQAFAKLNLTLDVTGREGGYHTLDSIAVTVDLADRIRLVKRKDRLCTVLMRGMGSDIPPERNNALKAAEAFVSRFSTAGVDIFIDKNIPVGAGMGGSSADSAGVIAGMGRLFSIKREELKPLADEHGSDTGFLLFGGLARLGGRGEKIEPLPFAPMHFLVLVPRKGVETRECFAEYDRAGERGSRSFEVAAHLAAGEISLAARWFGNDLYPAAKRLSSEVEDAYLAVKALSPLGAGMTGSGSAVFGLFESRELCEWAKSRYRGPARALVLRSVDPGAQTKKLLSPFALAEEEEDL